jgi:hypothetical protein
MNLKYCFVVGITLLVVSHATNSFAQNPSTAVIDKYIAQQAAKYKASEYAEARKLMSGDLNHDGIPDTAVLYTIEGQNGSNNYIQYLAVFLQTKKAMAFAARATVGGKNRREIELVSITDGLINLNTVDYGPKDPSCCPTIKGTTKYALSRGVLKEQRQASIQNPKR